MPLSFAKKIVGGTATKAPPKTGVQQEGSTPAKTGILAKTKPVSTSLPSFMKVGKKAAAAVEQADAQAERAKEEAGKLFRFWMPEGEERRITFLDGDLDDDGLLASPYWNEHKVKVNGDWTSFPCTADEEPCPLCESGDSRQSLVSALTILDNTPHKIKSGPNSGKTIVHSRKLFCAARNTFKILNKQAVKRGGLGGCVFDVSRTGDKSPGVGDQFEFVEKLSLKEMMAKYDLKLEDVQPADYGKEVTMTPAEKLIEMGLGKAQKGPGYQKGVNKGELANEL